MSYILEKAEDESGQVVDFFFANTAGMFYTRHREAVGGTHAAYVFRVYLANGQRIATRYITPLHSTPPDFPLRLNAVDPHAFLEFEKALRQAFGMNVLG